MPAPYLFLITIVLSLSATAYTSQQCKNVAPVDDVGISNRDLFMLPRSNTSDGNSLNMNSKRNLPMMGTVTSTIEGGLFTVTAYFNGKVAAGVVLNTENGEAWVIAEQPTPEEFVRELSFLGAKLEARNLVVGIVRLQNELLASEMRIFLVPESYSKATKGYNGAIGLYWNYFSWQMRNIHGLSSIFAFYYGDDKAEFDLGDIREEYKKGIKWYNMRDFNSHVAKQATITVGGNVVREVGTFYFKITTGVPYIYGHPTDVESVYKNVKNSVNHDGVWMVPSNEQPVVSISLGKDNYPIHKFLVNDQCTKVEGKNYCQGILRSHPELPNRRFLFGVSFFDGKYVAFDHQKGLGLLVLKP